MKKQNKPTQQKNSTKADTKFRRKQNSTKSWSFMHDLLLLLVTLQAWRTHVSVLLPSNTRKSPIHLQECRNTCSSEHKAHTFPPSSRSRSFMGSWLELIEADLSQLQTQPALGSVSQQTAHSCFGWNHWLKLILPSWATIKPKKKPTQAPPNK